MASDPIPPFTREGLLPPGDYALTFDALRDSRLVQGPNPDRSFGEDADGPRHDGPWHDWDAAWRQTLTHQAETLCRPLWAVGIGSVFLDGSFTEAKAHPNDIDGYFACDVERIARGELQRELNRIDPKRCWTWDPDARRAYRGYAKRQLPMWHAYRVELYPHYNQFTGLTDEHGHPLTFPAAFRTRRRDAEPKGIVEIRPA